MNQQLPPDPYNPDPYNQEMVYEQPPEAPRKNGMWAKLGGEALTFAVIFHLIILVVGAFWIFQIIHPPEKKVDFMPPGGGGGERSAEHQVNQKKQKVITPTTNVKRVFAEGATSNYALPDPGDDFGQMSQLTSLAGGGMSGGLGGSGNGKGFGRGNGNGNGFGNGGGMGKMFGLLPDALRKRCDPKDRAARLIQNGGTPACEEAVMKGLRWLKSKQAEDGSWSGESKVAMTGLALLAYFGHCETPASPEFGDSCVKGISYLVNVGMKNDGKMADNMATPHWSYEHAIATYALGEAATFCKEIKQDIPYLLEITEKAGQFIIDSQNDNGGWAYSYAMEGGHVDLSVTGWQIQALKACDHVTSIKWRGMQSCISRALKWTKGVQAKDGGFGYTGPASHTPYFTLTGVGMLCHQMWGKGGSPEVRKGAKYVLENTKFDYNGECCDLYGHYYESQAMMQLGGENWSTYNKLFRDQILNNQAADGSWKPPGGGKTPRAVAPTFIRNDVYRTCLCTLMLEVYYRFLSTGGGGRGGAIERPEI